MMETAAILCVLVIKCFRASAANIIVPKPSWKPMAVFIISVDIVIDIGNHPRMIKLCHKWDADHVENQRKLRKLRHTRIMIVPRVRTMVPVQPILLK
jgi:hypothetical protein